MYIWTRRLTGQPLAGLIAGTIFAFSPFRYASYLVGHLNLLGTQWLPIYFMGLVQILQPGRRSRFDVLVTAAGISLVALSSIHYLYMTAVLTLAVLIGALLVHRRSGAAQVKQSAVSLMAAFLIALPALGLAVAPYLDLAQRGGITVRSIEYVRQFSASPTDFVLPATFHPLWGRWVGDHFDRSYWPEATLYLGAAAIVLAVAAFWWSGQGTVTRRTVSLLGLSALAALILALGVNLYWLSQPVWINTPKFLLQWHPSPQARIPLPGYLLFKTLPFYSSMRVWMRYGVFAVLFVSALAGIGAAVVAGKLRGWSRRAVGALMLGLVLFDFWPKQQPFARVENEALDTWLAGQPGKGAVAPFPFERADSQPLIYRTLVNGKPFVGGLYGAYSTAQSMRIGAIMDGFPSEESVSLLHELGIQYALVWPSAYPEFQVINDEVEKLGLKRLADFGDTVVYEVP